MPQSRRAVLTSLATGTALLAGCSATTSDPAPDDPPAPGADELPDPDSHVYGATGKWSSFGCNAANNRAVADGKAPVDGVTEQWRVGVPGPANIEPIVAGDTVYLTFDDSIRALDAATGDERWRAPADAAPLVRDDTVYVTTGNAIRALDPASGERQLEKKFGSSDDLTGRVTAPATLGGDQLVAGVGEHVVALDAATGDLQWFEEVFGQVLDHPAYFSAHWSVVATEAGMVYLFDKDGLGTWKWQLPAPPVSPPIVDSDSIFVNCRDGNTYALMDDGPPSTARLWEVDTGWAPGGLGVAGGLVVAAGGGSLRAIDAESGDEQWSREVGDWRHTAPTFARDTVFVGGDSLYAFDPTPGGDAAGGPALRFQHEFAGRVGPGPVLDDGTLYVFAEVEAEKFALVALA
jgi:outer membrane protein assembly factor BamB